VVVVTHAAELVDALHSCTGVSLLALGKEDGETKVQGQGLLDEPAWHWPGRG
jgi:predicted ATPase